MEGCQYQHKMFLEKRKAFRGMGSWLLRGQASNSISIPTDISNVQTPTQKITPTIETPALCEHMWFQQLIPSQPTQASQEEEEEALFNMEAKLD